MVQRSKVVGLEHLCRIQFSRRLGSLTKSTSLDDGTLYRANVDRPGQAGDAMHSRYWYGHLNSLKVSNSACAFGITHPICS